MLKTQCAPEAGACCAFSARRPPVDYIQITKENIDKEHICCAMSGKQSLAKKEWL